MDSKQKLLKDLGFSDEFLKALENNSFENSFYNSDSNDTSYDSLNTQENDITSLIVQKTDEPLNLNAIFISE